MATGDRTIVVIILAFGFLTRFACLNYPREVVWDEFHFGAMLPFNGSNQRKSATRPFPALDLTMCTYSCPFSVMHR